MLVDINFYLRFGGIKVKETEFSLLSQRAEAVIDSLVRKTIPHWRFNDYKTLKDSCDIKAAICYEIETLAQSNGVQSTTGGADSGDVEMLGGIPLAVISKTTVIQFLRDNDLMYRGFV